MFLSSAWEAENYWVMGMGHEHTRHYPGSIAHCGWRCVAGATTTTTNTFLVSWLEVVHPSVE
jgi:hypothetical protein